MTVVEMQKGKGKERGPAVDQTVDPELHERASAAIGWLQDQYKALGSWLKVARLIGGYSESSIKVFASGSYPGNAANVITAIEAAREFQRDRSSELFTPAFCETSITRRIRRAVKQTRLRGQLGVIAGKSGIGKTSTFAEMMRADTRIIYIRCNPTHSGNLTAALTGVFSALGVGSGRGITPSVLYVAVRDTLAARRALLLIDEAQFLSRTALDALRTISEDADTPILFSGNETLHEFGFLAGINPAAFVQFTSRCMVREHLQPSEITANDVRLIAAQILSEPVLEETAELLLGQARSSGAFRRLHSVLQRAYEKANGGEVQGGHVIDAVNRMTKLRGLA